MFVFMKESAKIESGKDIFHAAQNGASCFLKRSILMGDKGSKDKGTKEQKKKPKHTLKEKKKLKQEKKNK